MKHKVLIKQLSLVLVLCLGFFGLSYLSRVNSANLTTVSVTLSNPIPSFRGELAAGNTVGGSNVIINSTPGTWPPSTSTASLRDGDTVIIGEAQSMATYTITDLTTGTLNKFNVTPVLASGDADSGDDVISTSSTDLTVRFTTANALPNGSFRILVPALADNTSAADGLPDSGYFDFSTTPPTTTCPANITGYNFAAGTATASSVTLDGVDYHAFVCEYTGNGAIGTAFNGSTNDAITIGSLINPAPKSGHTDGSADTYRVIVQHLDSADAVRDSTTVSIGVIESVRVTAEVAPLITFQITGVNTGVTACGDNTTVTTTATTVPFGELAISSFSRAAQILAVSTNAENGYAVTAIANDQLGKGGVACTNDSTAGDCIPDSKGDNTAMSHTNEDEWASTSVKGFGFSLAEIGTTGLTPAFEYTSSTGNCSGGGDCFRQFADAEDSVAQDPTNIFTASDVADSHSLYVCYKTIIAATQAAGEYENYITYTATATF